MKKHNKIKINLSEKSVKDAIREIEEYKKDLAAKSQEIAQRLAEEGVQIACANITSLDAVFTGELLSSIHEECVDDSEERSVWAVVADSDHAMFVEFGTGIVGASSPYIGDFPSDVTWSYASGKTIRQLADGRYGWFYPADDGQWYFTEGMPSRPFMYHTANELMDMVVRVAKEVFENG